MPVIALVGPTSSGKSSLAVALARRLNCEIINFDVYQMYRRFQIGVGKMTSAEMAGVRHHFIDVIDPEEEFSVYQFQKECRALLDTNQLFIMTGGSNLYLSSVIYDYQFSNIKPVSPELEALETEEIYQKLLPLDPENATKFRHNKRRLVRAYHHFLETGKVIPRNTFDKEQPLYPVLFIRLLLDRDHLKERADHRVGQMMDHGLLKEVKTLMETVPLTARPFQAIGYFELADYLQGKCSLPVALKKMKVRTHQYIRRQETWLNNQYPNAFVVTPDDQAVDNIISYLKEKKWI